MSTDNVAIIVDFIRTFGLCLFSMYTNIKITQSNKRETLISKITIIILEIFICLLCMSTKGMLGFLNEILLMIILNSILYKIVSKEKILYSLLISTISLSMNYVLFSISIFINFIINQITNISNEFITIIFIMAVYIFLTLNVLKIKRIQKGINFLKEKVEDEYFSIIIVNISVIILFLISILEYYETLLARKLGTTLIIFSIIMCITIQKSLQLYYKHKMLIKTLEQTKEELEKAKSDVKKLEEENLNFSKISHTIAHKQKALQHKLEMLSKSNNNIETEKIKKQINDVTKELKQSRNVELTKTGIEEIDNMLDYMQSECIKNNIEFQLQVSGNIYHMINNYISKDDLETILADHIKDAIIAIKHTETTNRKILVRLGKINGVYAVYFCDTGVEFEINTLMELGKKPATTYKDEGGTGMGFMNTFDTLEKTKASLIIEEMSRPKENNFTKIIKVVFDNKKEYKIESYRYQEIEKQKTRNNLIIEKL